jgi:4-oxalocrotonate tautomerase
MVVARRPVFIQFKGKVNCMPFANIKVIENVFSEDEKRRLIEEVTEALVSVEGENLREKTVVIVEEVKSAHWGIGGQTVSAEHARELRGS